MAFRYAITFLLACVPCFAGSARYLPINTTNANSGKSIDGFEFFFEGAGVPSVSITITTSRGIETQTVETDRSALDRTVFKVLVPRDERFELSLVRIVIGGREHTIRRMKAGKVYELLSTD